MSSGGKRGGSGGNDGRTPPGKSRTPQEDEGKSGHAWRTRRVQGLGTVRLGPGDEGPVRLRRTLDGEEKEKKPFSPRTPHPVPPRNLDAQDRDAEEERPARPVIIPRAERSIPFEDEEEPKRKKAARKRTVRKNMAKKPVRKSARKKAAAPRKKAANGQSFLDWVLKGPAASSSSMFASLSVPSFLRPRRKRKAASNAGARRAAAKRPAGKRAAKKAASAVGYWAALTAAWGGILVGGVVFYHALTLPETEELWNVDQSTGVTLVAADGSVLANRGGFAGAAVPLRDLPPHLVGAVLATEDERFYSHLGIDPRGIARAAWVNLREGELSQGGSTITQQLAKNVFLEPDRTWSRKIHELLLSFWLEARFSKDEILTLYMNRVYLGAGAYGIEAASRRYFNKSARNVTLPEAAMLAGLLKAPSRYAPTRDIELARARAAVVIGNMVRAGYISEEEARQAIEHPAELKGYKGSDSVNYAADWLLSILPSYAGRPNSDMRVTSTIDPKFQRIAETVLREALARDGEKLGASQAALVAMTPDGAVRAMVGGRSYNESQFNRAVQARRQPGSAFKPFVYLAAIEAGMSPETVRVDAPILIDEWSPENYGREFEGPMTLHNALTRSVNTIAVQVSEEVGRKQVIRTARRMGLNSPMRPHPSLALGTFETTLLELTAAYAPFANGGNAVIPHGIDRVETIAGTTIYERRGGGPGRVMSPRALGAMNAMLQDVMSEGTGRRAQLSGRPAAGKTGTSQDSRDAWFIGYTADLVVGVWVGNDDSSPMNRVTGGTLPAAIWQDFMTRTQAGMPVASLPGDYEPSAYAQAAGGAANDNWPFSEPMEAQSEKARSFLDRIFGVVAQEDTSSDPGAGAGASDLKPGRQWR